MVIAQLFSDREREVELHWPSQYTPDVFHDGNTSQKLFEATFPAKSAVYVDGLCKREAGVLSTPSLQTRFERAGFTL